MKHFRVVFQPDGKEVSIHQGATLLEAAGQAGIILTTPCGGKGTCGKCAVRVVKGYAPAEASSVHGLSAYEVASGYRLACRLKPHGDLTVEVPATSRASERASLETRTIERVNFMACLSFVFGKNICQLFRRDIAIHVIIDQYHGAYTTSAQAAHGFQREASFRVGLAIFEIQCLLDGIHG